MGPTQRARRTTATIAAAAAAAVILAGCSGTTESTDTTATTATETGADAEATQFNDADVMYATGMIAHHQQAVEMSDIILAKADIGPEITTLAENIKAAQEPEIREMTDWLREWGQDPTADPGMMNHGGMDDGGMDHEGMDHGDMGEGDMDHGAMGDGMSGNSPGMGMLSAADLDELRAAEGVDASRLFLQQMIAHHEGAVTMAQQHLDSGRNPAALQLSEKVIADQTAEIAQMREMLANMP